MNKSQLHDRNCSLERRLKSVQNQCSTLETMRQVENLRETNFESFLVGNYFRLFFHGGQIYLPASAGVKLKVKAVGRYAKQC